MTGRACKGVSSGASPRTPGSLTRSFYQGSDVVWKLNSRANAKERYRMAPLPRKTSCAAQVALQHCPILHMSKRKSMIPTEFHTVNWLNWLRKPGSKPSGQVAQFAPDLRLRRTGISKRLPVVGCDQVFPYTSLIPPLGIYRNAYVTVNDHFFPIFPLCSKTTSCLQFVSEGNGNVKVFLISTRRVCELAFTLQRIPKPNKVASILLISIYNSFFPLI